MMFRMPFILSFRDLRLECWGMSLFRGRKIPIKIPQIIASARNSGKKTERFELLLFIDIIFRINIYQVNPGTLQKVKTVGYAVPVAIDNSFYSRLNYQLGTFHAW